MYVGAGDHTLCNTVWFLSTISTRGVPEKTFWDWLFTTGLAIGSIVTVFVLGIYAIYYYCGWQYYVDDYLERGWKAVNKCHWCSCGLKACCLRSRQQISDDRSQGTSSPAATASHHESSIYDPALSSVTSHVGEKEANMSEAIATVRDELLPFAEERCGPDALAFIDDDKIIGDCISTYNNNPNAAIIALRVWLVFQYPKIKEAKWTVEQADLRDSCSSPNDESPYTSRRRSSSSLQFTPLSRKLFHEERPTPLGFRATPAATSINGVRGSIEIPARRISLDSMSPLSVDDSSFDNIESDDSMSCAVRAIRLASLQFD